MEDGFKKLIAWQKADSLALEIYKTTALFPKSEIYALTNQFRRAAISVPANIAEGYERQYRKEYVPFLKIAQGSLAEIETYLMFAKDLRYITEDTYRELDFQRQETGKLLRGLVNSLK